MKSFSISNSLTMNEGQTLKEAPKTAFFDSRTCSSHQAAQRRIKSLPLSAAAPGTTNRTPSWHDRSLGDDMILQEHLRLRVEGHAYSQTHQER